MAEETTATEDSWRRLWRGIFAVTGIMMTLVIYGVLQVASLYLPQSTFYFGQPFILSPFYPFLVHLRRITIWLMITMGGLIDCCNVKA